MCICGGKGKLLEDNYGLPVKNDIWFRQYPPHFHLQYQKPEIKKTRKEIPFKTWVANKKKMEGRKRFVDRFLHGELGKRKTKTVRKGKKSKLRRITDNL